MIARFRWASAPRHQFRWIAQQGPTPAMARPGPPPTIAAVFGPKGETGSPGARGEPGDGATDPGDLTLIFDNHII